MTVHQHWETNTVCCKYCKLVVPRSKVNQVTCGSAECQRKRIEESVKSRSLVINKGIQHHVKGGVMVDTKCPKCGDIRKIEIDRPQSMRMRRDYCGECMSLMFFIDNSMGVI